MNNQNRRGVGQVLTGQALANAMQNYAAVRRLVADAQPVVIQEGGDENNPLNINSDHPAESGWRDDSLPDNLGRLNPPEDWNKETKVRKLAINGAVQLDGKEHPIRDFPFLPRFLSSNLPGKNIEAYFHQDSRIRYEDLWARMPSCTPPLTTAVKNHKYNNKRIREVRAPYHIPCFTARRSTVTRTDIEIAATLSREMIRQATVWPVTPNGIQDPSNPTRYLLLNTFLEPGSQFDQGSEKTWKAMYLHSVLNMIAKLKNASGDYRTLKRKYLPRSWSDRLSGRRAAPTSDGETDDDGKNGTPAQPSATQQDTGVEGSATGSQPRELKRQRLQEGNASEEEYEPALGATLRSDNQGAVYSRLSFLVSPAILPSERFEAAATLAQRRHQQDQQRRRPNVETVRSSRVAAAPSWILRSRDTVNNQQNHVWQPAYPHERQAVAHPVHFGRGTSEAVRAPQDSAIWAYGDSADRMVRQPPQAQNFRAERHSEQDAPELEPPSHGIPGLDDSDDCRYASRFGSDEFEDASDVNPFGHLR